MASSRLALALSEGLTRLPVTGEITVMRPRAGMDLSALPQDRVVVVQGFRPDHDVFAAQGYRCVTAAEGRAALSVVCLTRSKPESRGLIAAALARTDGPVVVDGLKTDGVESILRDLRKRGAEVGPAVSKAHGKTFVISAADVADWQPEETRVDGFLTCPGVFSADGPDPGSVMLAEALPARLPRQMADLGAGWGYLSRATLARDGVEALHVVEADHAALDCARRNLTDARAVFHWADATAWRPPAPLDGVVMNPPFHTARAAQPDLGRAFCLSAAAVLKPSGQLWLVANRHLPYELTLRDRFASVEEIAGDPRYKVLTASKPRRGGL